MFNDKRFRSGTPLELTAKEEAVLRIETLLGAEWSEEVFLGLLKAPYVSLHRLRSDLLKKLEEVK